MNENTTVALGKVQMTPKGEYSTETAYDFLDVVSYEGGSYLAKKPSQNIPVTNETYWLCLAERGTTGEAAGFGTPTATIDNQVGTPYIEITATGPDNAKVFSFAFHNMKGIPGVSPEVTIEEIEGGHQVTITDAEHPDGQSFNVMDGEDGASDAGEVTYDPDETYAEGSVGAALASQSSQIANLEALGLTVVNGEINITFDAEGETA